MDRHQEESSTRLSVTQISCNSKGEKTAVKYQCCGSGMFIPDPDFCPSWILDPGSRISDPGSRIPDPKTATKERGEKNLLYFFVVTNFTKLNIILFLKCWRKNLGQFSKNFWSFYPKNFHYALKYMGLWRYESFTKT